VSSAGSESYDDEEEESESESSSSSNSSSSYELEEPIGELEPSTDYFFSMDTQHKDFVRSMV